MKLTTTIMTTLEKQIRILNVETKTESPPEQIPVIFYAISPEPPCLGLCINGLVGGLLKDIGSFDRVRVNHSGINTKITWRRRVDGVYNVFNTSDFNDFEKLNSKSVA